jgi:hypothetical protein
MDVQLGKLEIFIIQPPPLLPSPSQPTKETVNFFILLVFQLAASVLATRSLLQVVSLKNGLG